jgi:hypothetical protein
MEAYSGYTENGRVIPVGNLPNGRRVIITVLDEVVENPRATQQEMALQAFKKGLQACAPLPSEFDDILENRVNIARELAR